MLRMIKRLLICLTATLILWPGNSMGVSMEDLDKRILDCDLVLKNALSMPDRGIPTELLQRCRGLAIFPGVMKLGIIVGIDYGSGVILHRDEKTSEWSKPCFFTIRTGSLGLQVGAQSTDLILLIMNEQSFRSLLEDKFAVGANVSVAAGPVGRDASAETNMAFSSGILSYSRSQGIFVGLSLKGAALEPDSEANTIYHGKDVSVQDVYYEGQGSLSDDGRILLETLNSATQGSATGAKAGTSE
jgi:SH3 domain-containing YSC84-like protein 1